MKLYFKRGVVSGFIITILIINGLGVYAYVSIRKLIEASVVQSRSLLITTNAEKVLATAINLETGQRGYVITGDSNYLEPYDMALHSMGNDLETLRRATEGFPEKRADVDRLQKLVDRKMKIVKNTVEARSNGFEVAKAQIQRGDGKRVMDSIRAVIKKITSTETDNYVVKAASSGNLLGSIQYIFTGALMIPAVTVVVLFVSINSNLNKREEAARRLQAANADISKLNKELESFSYSVSHDLRAPLRSVNGYANVLLEDYGDVLDENATRTINIIAKNGRRMGELIDDLLTFSRLGRKELMHASLPMNDVVRDVIDEIRETNQYDNNIRIDVRNLPNATADMSMIRQVWYNLISNALKYSGKTKNPAVEIGSFLRNNDVCYYVKDNGVGFDMAYVEKLFGIFQRLHKQDEFEGTGVGLALIKRIIDRHNGKVWAEGALNQGATFYFSLPRNT
ncbi:MAG: CHASE3 domain-containing protein [Bacteroidota bacterium]